MKKDNYIETQFTYEDAEKVLTSNYDEAEKLLNDSDKLDEFFVKLEKKLKDIPKVGDKLAMVPELAMMVKDYVGKKYTAIPVGSILAVISALLYFVSPIDVIPDVIPGIGHIDDALVVGLCLKWISDDVQEYLNWRKGNGMNI